KQQGVSNSTNKQDPVNNLSNTLPPFNNTTYTNNNLSNTFTSVRISNVRFTKSLIKNTKAFTYEEAFENIKNIKNKYSKDMNLLWKIVEIIRNERKKEAMDLSVGGILTNFLVEEIMVLTNSLVGKELIRKRGKGCLLRIHTESEAIRSMCTEGVTYKDSSIKGMEGVNYMDSSIKGGVGVNNKDSNLKGVNYKDNIKDLKDTKDINNISSKHHIIRPSNVDIKVWRSYMARCMDRAKYFINNGNIKELKHYGLGLDVYTHFTSPIRRYADILVHRQLYEVCSNNSGCDTINTEISNNRIENNTGSSITNRFDNNNDSPTNNNKNKNSSSSTNNTNNTITILSDCTVNRLNDKNYSAKVVSRESRMLKIYYQVSGSVMEGCVIGVKDNGVIIYIPDCDVEGFVKVEEENKYELFDNIRVKVGGNYKKFFSGRGYDFEIGMEGFLVEEDFYTEVFIYKVRIQRDLHVGETPECIECENDNVLKCLVEKSGSHDENLPLTTIPTLRKQKVFNNDRECIIEKTLKGHSMSAIASMYRINYQMVNSIVTYLKTGLVFVEKRGGDRRSKLPLEIKESLQTYVDL
ncbi:exoribonuclease, partial [Hamiltosporidium tvaerminnensis]